MNTTRATPRTSAVWAALAAAGVLAAVLIAHWPVLHAGATCFDDAESLHQNPSLQNPGLSSAWRCFREVTNSPTVSGYYEPLTLVSLMVDVAMGGRPDNLAPFHRTNLALHVLNVLLLMVLIALLFHEPWAAIVAGLLFGLHPLTVEPVAWVWERKTLLATFVAFLSLIFYVLHARRGGPIRYTASLAMCVLALLSKPTAVPLPVCMLLLDIWPLRRLNRRSLLEKLPFLTVCVVAGAVTIVSTACTAGVTMPGGRSVAEIVLRIVYLVPFYLGKIIWPVDLTPDYPLPQPLALSNPWIVSSLVVLGLLTLAIVISTRWTPALVVGALVFFVLILPMLGIVGWSWVTVSDKYVYLSSLGILLTVAAGLAWMLRRIARASKAQWPRITLALAVVGVGTVEAVGVRNYLKSWRDSEALFRHMVTVAPDQPHALVALGLEVFEKGRTQEAIDYFTRATQADPNHIPAFNCLGDAYMAQNRLPEAVEQFRKSIRIGQEFVQSRAGQGDPAARFSHIRPGFIAFAHAGLAVALARLDRPDEAVEQFRLALKINPDMQDTEQTLAKVLAVTGRTDEAMFWFRRTLRYPVRNASAYCDLGDVFIAQRRTREAMECYLHAWELDPDSLRVLNNYAWLLATSDDSDGVNAGQAVLLAEQACRQAGRDEPGVLDTLAAAYGAAGRFSDAVQTAQRAIDLARASKQDSLATDIGARLLLYKAERPYRERPGTSTATAPAGR